MNQPSRPDPTPGRVLWWGRFDPDYSRNRILRQCIEAAGWRIVTFRPAVSRLGALQARFALRARPDVVFVPAFRQRDIAAAAGWARRRGIPVLIDPFISAYDKQVDERGKLAAGSRRARRLLAWERERFAMADRVLADTRSHAEYFNRVLGVPHARVDVVPVGAEETLFRPATSRPPGSPPEVLFFGSFIPLQGPRVIVEAAQRYEGPPVTWTLLGDGPLRAECVRAAAGMSQVRFEEWIDYAALPARIARADILLGIFGTTPKARRVIPNKAYQALACAKPLVTLRGEAYPQALLDSDEAGVQWVPPGDPQALADAVAKLAAAPDRLAAAGARARETYERYFSTAAVCESVVSALARVRADAKAGAGARSA